MRTLVIEVSGGVVQQVYCDDPLRVVKVDWDAGESPGDACVSGELVVQPFVTLPSDTRQGVGKLLE